LDRRFDGRGVRKVAVKEFAQMPVEVAPSSRVATIESMSASRDVTTRTGVEQEASDADASV
jgi:hypothetical protein